MGPRKRAGESHTHVAPLAQTRTFFPPPPITRAIFACESGRCGDRRGFASACTAAGERDYRRCKRFDCVLTRNHPCHADWAVDQRHLRAMYKGAGKRTEREVSP